MSFLVPPCASIPGERQPRTHYQVLGISRNEQDPRVIEEAALRCTGHLRAYQLTSELEVSLRLNEIALALIVLLDPAQRQEYDRGLGEQTGRAAPERCPPQQTAACGETALVLLVGEDGACDVKLVYRNFALQQID